MDALQDLHNELYRAQTTDSIKVLMQAIGKARILLARYRDSLVAPVSTPEPFQKALDLRIAQGWQLGGNACPLLYTDTINGAAVGRDDLWIATTAGLKGAPAAAAGPKDLLTLAVQCMKEVDDGAGPRVIMGPKVLERFASALATPASGASAQPRTAWCSRCGCGNDAAGYAHLAACPTQQPDDTPLETGEGDARG